MSLVYRRSSLWLFLGPAVFLFICILLFPIFYNVAVSFYDDKGVQVLVGNYEWSGLRNYLSLCRDESFLNSARLLLVFTVCSTGIEIAIALIFAIYLDQFVRVPSWVQTLIILPMFVIPAVSGLTFRYLFEPENGIIANILQNWSILAPDMFGNSRLSMVLVIAQDVWRMWPFLFLIIFAGLKTIPREPLEAIKLDGASKLQAYRYIIFPAIYHTIAIAILLKLIESLKAFTEVYVMTGGGPGESTNILSMYIVKKITEFSRFGEGSAASMMLLVVGIAFAVLLNILKKNQAKV